MAGYDGDVPVPDPAEQVPWAGCDISQEAIVLAEFTDGLRFVLEQVVDYDRNPSFARLEDANRRAEVVIRGRVTAPAGWAATAAAEVWLDGAARTGGLESGPLGRVHLGPYGTAIWSRCAPPSLPGTG